MKKQLIIIVLGLFSFAASFAKTSTLISQFNLRRLRIQTYLTFFANEKSLYIKQLGITRLHNRLQICQLSLLTFLQEKVVLFKLCKEKSPVNQTINPNFFAAFFAINPN